MIFFGPTQFDLCEQSCYIIMMQTTYNLVIEKVQAMYKKSLELNRLINETPCTVSEEELRFLINDIQTLAREIANTYDLIQK